MRLLFFIFFYVNMFDLIAIETCTSYFIFIVNPVQFNLAFFILNICICKSGKPPNGR